MSHSRDKVAKMLQEHLAHLPQLSDEERDELLRKRGTKVKFLPRPEPGIKKDD
jgi:hypothetical protein